MQDIIQFLANHWLLTGAFLIVLAITAITEIQEGNQNSKHHIGTQAAILLMNRQGAVVIDLRAAEDFHKGHIIDAKNFPLDSLSKNLKPLKKLIKKPLILVSEQGIVKADFIESLLQAGAPSVNVIKGGMYAWNTENLPTNLHSTDTHNSQQNSKDKSMNDNADNITHSQADTDNQDKADNTATTSDASTPQTAVIEVYSGNHCPYCVQAKRWFDSKNLTYTEILVDQDDALRQKMQQRAGGKRSIPQIFINDQHIGGYDDLMALVRKGEIDNLLK